MKIPMKIKRQNNNKTRRQQCFIIEVVILLILPSFFKGFYLIFDINSNVLGLRNYIDFSKTYAKQAILSQKSSKNRAKTHEIHRLYHKTSVFLTS